MKPKPFAIVNDIILPEALDTLEKIATPILFSSKDIAYPSLSGHIDVFLFQHNNTLVAAPNTPSFYLSLFDTHNIGYILGETPITVNNCTAYNVVANNSIALHNFKHTDSVVIKTIKHLNQINCPQAYSRCSTLLLENAAITSDKGIEKALIKNNIDTLYVNQKDILLPGHSMGCFGGCCGITDNTVVINGNLDHHSQGNEIRQFIAKNGYNIIELSNTALLDVGSIFFVKDK